MRWVGTLLDLKAIKIWNLNTGDLEPSLRKESANGHCAQEWVTFLHT
jgi:hypothetical protein